MYLYYEHHRDGKGKVALTELRLSSRADGSLYINFRNPVENMVFEAVKPLLKWPPLANYSYEPNLKLWSYFGQYGVSSTYGEEVIKKVQTVVEALGARFKAFSVEDLADQCVNNHVDLSGKRKPKMSAEEFFYNHGTPALAPVASREEVEKKLAELMQVDISYFGSLFSASERKKSYRLAALRYHPDRNNGDGSKMSELNMFWQLYQSFEVKEKTTV
jgi:hypothetical protein